MQLRTKLLYGGMLAGVLALLFAFTARTPAASAAEPKNLKVLPKGTDKKAVKKIMKSVADALGVKCDHCHNLDDMAADTEKKEAARAMMLMVGKINKDNFKGEMRVTCVTCHNGAVKPK